MKALIEEVLALQHAYTARPTEEMLRRGRIVRNEIPAWVTTRLDGLKTIVPGATDDLAVDASDGAGSKAKVPWTRVYSMSRAPSASEGWYIVYLFDALGDAAYVSLMQGTTKWSQGRFEPRPPAEVIARSAWARQVLSERIKSQPGLEVELDLQAGHTGLPGGYERANVAALRYAGGSVPDELDLDRDLRFMIGLLGRLYLAEESTLQMPGDPPPEVVDALTEAVAVASPRRKRPRMILSHAERLAVERRAVDVATQYLEEQGYAVKDVGAQQSYDLDARRGDEHIFVEVKGTTSDGDEVVLTKNEVELHREVTPSSMLIVVANVHLDRTVMPPAASEGELRCIHPWDIADANLSAISFRYAVPRDSTS